MLGKPTPKDMVFCLEVAHLAGQFLASGAGDDEHERRVDVAKAGHRPNSGFSQKSLCGADYLHMGARLRDLFPAALNQVSRPPSCL